MSNNPIRHVSLLLSRPLQALHEVRNGGWVTPILALVASVGFIAKMPGRPEVVLNTLKWWSIMQGAAVVSIWLAGWPQGGRGTLAHAFKVVAFLTLVDGLALYATKVYVFLQFYALIAGLIPVFMYFAVKAIHEYENEALAFRVTASAWFIFEYIMLQSGWSPRLF